MSDDAPDPAFRDNAAARRLELPVGDIVAFIDYALTDDGGIILIHTEVPQALNGQGVGGRLVRSALLDIRRRGLWLRPDCPFVAAYMTRHPEFDDLRRPA